MWEAVEHAGMYASLLPSSIKRLHLCAAEPRTRNISTISPAFYPCRHDRVRRTTTAGNPGPSVFIGAEQRPGRRLIIARFVPAADKSDAQVRSVLEQGAHLQQSAYR